MICGWLKEKLKTLKHCSGMNEAEIEVRRKMLKLRVEKRQ